MTIKRYEYDQHHGMFEAEDGEWVLWEDVKEASADLEYAIHPIHGPVSRKIESSPACGEDCEYCA